MNVNVGAMAERDVTVTPRLEEDAERFSVCFQRQAPFLNLPAVEKLGEFPSSVAMTC